MTDCASRQHPYQTLTPELVIDAIESTGRVCDLRILALNSYENRVYQIGIEQQAPLIAKFYRPERWSDQQIAEEHRFCLELAAHEIPVVPPLADERGNTLHYHAGFRFALFPRFGGHAPELSDLDRLLGLGRMMGRIHAIGAQRDFSHRPPLSVDSFGWDSYRFLLEHFIPADLRPAYASLGQDLLQRVQQAFANCRYKAIRSHGDCHAGNILCRGEQIHFVDLDDCRMAPAIQDLWMFLSGEREQQNRQLLELVEGYNEFYDFEARQLTLIEPLRSLRIMHYSAWLARRWQDPAFPHNFPWFNTPRYWSEHILQLREQLALLNEPPLQLF